MGDQGNYGSSGILRWYVQSLSEMIETDNFVENEKFLAERALEQMRSAEFIRDQAMEKIRQINPVLAEEIEQCMRLLLHGAYTCGAFVPTLNTSGRGTLRRNTAKARKAARENEDKIDEMRRREASIVDALLAVSDEDWERSSNYSIAKSVEGQAAENFWALGGEGGPERKTIQRWISDNIRKDRTR